MIQNYCFYIYACSSLADINAIAKAVDCLKRGEIVALKGLDYVNILSFEKASSTLFISILQYPILCIIPAGLAMYTFILNNRYLRSHLYIEELVSEKKLKAGKSYAFLDRLGNVGDIIALDLKLIFRNKRPKSLVILSGVILLYGFLFYPKYVETENYAMLFFFAMLITGIFITNYGQFLFSWQSSHFDGMMTYNTNMHQYIKAKFSLFLTVCTLQFLLASFYGLMSWRLLPIQAAAFLYCIGVNSFITIYASTYNYKYMDLRKSASMNFQGIGAIQWLQSLAISFGPAIIFYLLNKFLGFWLLFVFAWGLVVLLIVLGTFSGAIKALPKSGFWMETVERIFGLLLIGAALYYVRYIISESAFVNILGLFLIVTAVFSGGFDRMTHESTAFQRAKKAFGIIAFIFGTYLLVGHLLIKGFILPPLSTTSSVRSVAAQEKIDWVLNEEEGLRQAKAGGKVATIDFWAEWCAACKEFEKFTYTDSGVIKESRRFVNIKIDCTNANDPKVKQLWDKYGVVGLPTIVFINKDGTIARDKTITGFVNASEFLRILQGME